ncbi:hypothetical protein ACFVIM_30530, partial [Streptomyces sp. NPDC057638]
PTEKERERAESLAQAREALAEEAAEEEEKKAAAGDDDGGGKRKGLPRWLPARLLRRGGPPAAETPAVEKTPEPAAEKAPPRGFDSPFLLVAAALLVAGALFSSYVVLGLGWLCAYASNKLTMAQRKFAVLVLPGVVALTGIVWAWSRVDEASAELDARQESLKEVLGGAWPWMVKGAAFASALYLVLRARRRA